MTVNELRAAVKMRRTRSPGVRNPSPGEIARASQTNRSSQRRRITDSSPDQRRPIRARPME